MVTYAVAVDPMAFDRPWHIHWAPKAGPYPQFEGELTALGAAFDLAVGGKIAAATAAALLERIGGEMEARYARDERAKERLKNP